MKFLKKIDVIALILGIVSIGSIMTVCAEFYINAREVSYENESHEEENNIAKALDDIIRYYSTYCPEGYTCELESLGGAANEE